MTCITGVVEQKNVTPHLGGDTPSATTNWVHEVLEPDQLSSAKQRFGRRALSGRTVVLLWGLRIYVALMVLLIGFQIWNALHSGS